MYTVATILQVGIEITDLHRLSLLKYIIYSFDEHDVNLLDYPMRVKLFVTALVIFFFSTNFGVHLDFYTKERCCNGREVCSQIEAKRTFGFEFGKSVLLSYLNKITASA